MSNQGVNTDADDTDFYRHLQVRVENIGGILTPGSEFCMVPFPHRDRLGRPCVWTIVWRPSSPSGRVGAIVAAVQATATRTPHNSDCGREQRCQPETPPRLERAGFLYQTASVVLVISPFPITQNWVTGKMLIGSYFPDQILLERLS